MQHRERFAAAVAYAASQGAVVVAAEEDRGVRWLPGALDDGVIPVQADWSCERDAYAVVTIDGRTVIRASPYPRDIPGIPARKTSPASASPSPTPPRSSHARSKRAR